MANHRIGLISDLHASPRALEDALALFREQRVTQILCGGDIAGYFDTVAETVDLLKTVNCDCIIGNHDVSYLSGEQTDKNVCDFLSALPTNRRYTIDGCRIYLVHAEPPDELHGGIKLLDIDGEFIESRLQQWEERLQDFDADILKLNIPFRTYMNQRYVFFGFFK